MRLVGISTTMVTYHLVEVQYTKPSFQKNIEVAIDIVINGYSRLGAAVENVLERYPDYSIYSPRLVGCYKQKATNNFKTFSRNCKSKNSSYITEGPTVLCNIADRLSLSFKYDLVFSNF